MAGRRRDLFQFPNFTEVDPRASHIIHETFYKTTHKYVVSASKELVAFLNALKCKHCEQKRDIHQTFSADRPPYIAICGHYVHKECRYVNRETTGAQWFSCFICCKRRIIMGPRPSDSAVFEDFYKKVEEGGLPCSSCEEDENMHPRYNVVQITHRKNKEDPEYLCVWCYVEKGNHCGKVLDKEHHIEKQDVLGLEPTKLKSVDSTLHCKKIINFQCCCCMKPLIPSLDEPEGLGSEFDKPVEGKEDLEHLECGHIRHKDCKLEFDGKEFPADEQIRVYCHLCGNNWSVEEAKEKSKAKVSHLKEYAKENIGYSAFYCHGCDHFHPITNEARQPDNRQTQRMCVWCKAGELMYSREEDYKSTKLTPSKITRGTDKGSSACSNQ